MQGGKRTGAGRPHGTKKEPTTPYHRRVLPRWIPILDKQLERLKQMQKEKIQNLKRFVKLIGDFLHSDGLRESIRADWDNRLEDRDKLIDRMLTLYSAVEYKNVQDDIRLLWNDTAILQEELNANCPEWDKLQEEAELIEIYYL